LVTCKLPIRRATFSSRRGEISQNNNIRHIIQQLYLTS
jgi:hypothetical protein